jgi:hypothetical protein
VILLFTDVSEERIVSILRVHEYVQLEATRRPGFKPGSGQVGFVVDKVALG